MIGFLWREDTKFQWYNKKIVTLYSAIEKYLSKCLQIKKIDYLCAPKNVERFDRLQPLEKMLKC